MKKRRSPRFLAALLAALMLLSLAACAASAPDTADPSDPAAQTQQSQSSGAVGKKDDASAKSDAAKPDDKQNADRKDETKKDEIKDTPANASADPTPEQKQKQKEEQKPEDTQPDEQKKEEEKKEEEKKEEPKQDEQKKEEPKQDEPKKEEPKKEEPKQETSGKPSGTTSTTPSAPSNKPSAPSKTELTCTISISCSSVLKNIDKCDPSVRDYIPSNGTILSSTTVTFSPGSTVFDILTEVCNEYGISLEYSFSSYGSYYIEGIGSLYEKDVGDTSGWMYKVNGSFPGYGCSSYELKGGERISWVYTCDLGSDVGGSGAL